jgi:hypothetical protein
MSQVPRSPTLGHGMGYVSTARSQGLGDPKVFLVGLGLWVDPITGHHP